MSKRLKMGFTDLMIDLETCSTAVNAVICTIGMVAFNIFDPTVTPEKVIIYVDKADCEQLGLDVDPGTMAWWEKQPAEARAEAFDAQPRVKLVDAMKTVNEKSRGIIRFWCQGLNFDAVILESAMKAVNLKPNWKFWQWRDARTVCKMAPSLPKREGVHHSAVADAEFQVECVKAVFKAFNIRNI